MSERAWQMHYHAVLFDLDGTLLDTLADLADSMNAALEGLGFPRHPEEAYRYFVGDGVKMLAARALPDRHRSEETIGRAVEAVRAQYARRWDCKTRPYEGIPELLSALSRRGVTAAVLSNKPDDFTKLCVAKLLPDWQFAAVQGVSETVPPKPDPTGAVHVTRGLGIPAGEFLYLGDTNTDMKTAVAAGMFPVGAAWGFRTADELRANGARKLIDHPMELLELL
ncbi:MAG TPA: HAD family hydrolase [Phycisphaerae bacterium]|nr:HAD family hydrolase [Phycisphaerae bacterium]